MKTTLTCICFLLILHTRITAQNFSVAGKAIYTEQDSIWDKKVYLLKINHIDHFFSGSLQQVVDSAIILTDGSFEFTNSNVIENDCIYRLNVIQQDNEGNGGAIYMIGTTENFLFLLLNKNSRITLETKLGKFGYNPVFSKADKANYLINTLSRLRNKQNRLIDSLVIARRALDPEIGNYKNAVKKINAQIINSGNTTHTYERIKNFADTVSNPYVSLLATSFLPVDAYKGFLAKMNTRYKKEIPTSAYAMQFDVGIKGVSDALQPGQTAPALALPDMNGALHKLSELKGKYVLVDFWASWCLPCRSENVKTILPLYNKYKTKGFTVLSISMDINRDNWIQAVQKDGIGNWWQLCDLKGQAGHTAVDYRIKNLPYSYLVDPQGIIIAKDLRGVELESALEKILK